MKGSKIILRRYREGDEFSIVKLLRTVWPDVDKWRDTRFWRWRYERNPSGSPIVWVAESAGKIVGHRAIIPVYMKIGSVEALVGLVADSCVHPSFRRQGIYRSLVSLAQEESVKRGMQLTYGIYIPSHLASYKGYEKRGAICPMVSLVKLLSWRRLGKIFLGTPLFASPNLGNCEKSALHVFQISQFNERFNSLWRRLSPHFPIIVKRDKEYLQWRYFEIPSKDYVVYVAEDKSEILGFCVLKERIISAKDFSKDHFLFSRFMKKPVREGLIIDVFGFPKAVKSLLAKAEEHFKEKGVDIIHCRLSEKNPYLGVFAKLGYRRMPFSLRMVLSVALNLRGKITDRTRAFKEALQLSQNTFFLRKKNWCIFFAD